MDDAPTDIEMRREKRALCRVEVDKLIELGLSATVIMNTLSKKYAESPEAQRYLPSKTQVDNRIKVRRRAVALLLFWLKACSIDRSIARITR